MAGGHAVSVPSGPPAGAEGCGDRETGCTRLPEANDVARRERSSAGEFHSASANSAAAIDTATAWRVPPAALMWARRPPRRGLLRVDLRRAALVSPKPAARGARRGASIRFGQHFGVGSCAPIPAARHCVHRRRLAGIARCAALMWSRRTLWRRLWLSNLRAIAPGGGVGRAARRCGSGGLPAAALALRFQPR